MDITTNTNLAACRICGGQVAFKFSAMVLGDTHADYHECERCRSLTVLRPTWMERAYALRLTPDPDQGALLRTLFIHRALRRLRSWPTRLVRRHGRVLDFGCGYGLLLRLLADDRHQVWGVDEYPRAIFCEDRVTRALPEQGQFDLVIASEVVEHLLDPMATVAALKKKVDEAGLLIITTELYVSGKHGADWHYLVPAHGQHVTFYSGDGLRGLMRRNGLQFVGSHRLFGQEFLFVFAPEQRRGLRWRWPLLAARQTLGEL
jgi:SAM-dependent methyltransferase